MIMTSPLRLNRDGGAETGSARKVSSSHTSQVVRGAESDGPMEESTVHRRLTAILAADVVTYSRLMGLDEVGTHAAWKSYRNELIEPNITHYGGRIVKLTGDGFLAEFSSVVSAVACAVITQRAMRERNVAVPQDRRIEIRMGINLGDVIVEAEDIHGDDVNVAARLENIAEAGGITVSAAVRDNVGNRLDLRFEDMGEQVLKNR